MGKVVEDVAIERSDPYLLSSGEELLRVAKRESYQTLDTKKTELEEINWLKQKKKGVCDGNRGMSPNLGHYKVNRSSDTKIYVVIRRKDVGLNERGVCHEGEQG